MRIGTGYTQAIEFTASRFLSEFLAAQAQRPSASMEDKELLRFLIARKWQVDAAVEQCQADV